MTIARPLALAVLVALPLAGCYTYRPVTAPVPAPGTRIAATLTDSGTLEMARYIGPGIGQVEGRVIGTDDRGVVLGVLLVRNHEGIENYWKGERVVFPRNYLTGVRERHLSGTRTALTTVGTVAAAYALGAVFNIGGLGGGGGRGNPGPGGGHQ